jgi:hypothetical protein
MLITNYTLVVTPDWKPADHYTPPYDAPEWAAEPFGFQSVGSPNPAKLVGMPLSNFAV